MEGTRTEILRDLEDWASDGRSPEIYWLKGMVGTGKLSIAHSFCELLDKKGMLGGSFAPA